jgi:hypothetical protein
MTDLSQSKNLVYKAKHKIRFVTAASLFDGHDASINIMRRILQASGAEVIHLGHNRSVDDVVTTALRGGRAGHRDLVLPGRPHRVSFKVHGRPAARGSGGGDNPDLRRRRRRDRGLEIEGTARYWRHAHLFP